MQTATATAIERAELPSMLATLCSYESRFGPYHPHTICLTAQVAFAFSQFGEFGRARELLERVVRDSGRSLGQNHQVRVRALAVLRDLLVAQADYERAGSIQRELVECQIQRLGQHHSDVVAARAQLAMIMLEGVTCDSNRKV